MRRSPETYEEIFEKGTSNGMTIEHELLKQKVLRILCTSIQNSDLSWKTVDKRFIEQIEKL